MILVCFALCVDALSIIIHFEYSLALIKFNAYFKIHKNLQNLFESPVSSTIKDRNSLFYKIQEIIDHLPVIVGQTTELVTPFVSQLYCLFKFLLKYSFININNQFVI